MMPTAFSDCHRSSWFRLACACIAGIVILILPVVQSSAQVKPGSHPYASSRFSLRLSAAIETNAIHGDIQDNSAYLHGVKSYLNPGFAFQAGMTVLDVPNTLRFSFATRIGYHYIRITVDSILRNQESALELSNHIVDATILGEFDFLDLELIRPFFAGGIGFMFFQPEISTSEAVLRQYSYVFDNPDRSGVLFPLAFGLKYTPVPRLELTLQFQKMFTLTDNLDGWTSGKNDNLAVFSFGVAYTLGYSKSAVVRTLEEERRLKETDSDGDGLSDWDELDRYGTNPAVADTDEDGLSDGDEVLKYFTDPLQPDTDGDGLFDGDEVVSYKTNPQRVDTDKDGCDDRLEAIDMHTDPLRPDTDGDGLSDCDERTIYQTDPLKTDSDKDGIPDGAEVQRGTDPKRPNK